MSIYLGRRHREPDLSSVRSAVVGVLSPMEANPTTGETILEQARALRVAAESYDKSMASLRASHAAQFSSLSAEHPQVQAQFTAAAQLLVSLAAARLDLARARARASARTANSRRVPLDVTQEVAATVQQVKDLSSSAAAALAACSEASSTRAASAALAAPVTASEQPREHRGPTLTL